jgi:formylglycine-generating enzyme
MKRIILCLAILLAACSGEENAKIAPDAGETTTSDMPGAEICTPVCEGKACGDDGCGSNCGTCKMQLETCSDEGLCIPTPCTSSKDCPGDLVCAKELGQCVICVGNEDCPGGKTCGADHECHEEFACSSDIDCKSMDMICDKEAGKCVECLDSAACPDEQYCLDTFCVDALCTAGEAHCDGLDVVACNADGSAEAITTTCTDTQYCEEGQCHDQVCPPGEVYCNANILSTCDDTGKQVIDAVDCAEDSEICHDGECVTLDCDPGTVWCEDDLTAVLCADDGMSSSLYPCGAEHYCEDGACNPWLCEPGTVFCDGEIYKVCNDKGSAIQYEEDCSKKDQHCHAGMCINTVCPPDMAYCSDNVTVATCVKDGMSFTSEACPAEHYCDEGTCLAWTCQPLLAFCEDNTAKVCNGKGSAVSNEVPCGDMTCTGGACKPVICEAGTSNCDGKTVMQCDATGTVLQGVQTCGENQYCEEVGNAAACADQLCGNGALDPGEECDDGNTVDGDGCSGECKVEDMVTVAQGAFWMGCNPTVDNQCDADESPYHQVGVGTFGIDIEQTTVERYSECVDAGTCSLPSSSTSSCNWGKVDKQDHPINCITWDQAQTVCAWAGKRLCTEAEWEKAARGGCDLYNGNCSAAMPKYPWGATPVTCNHANYHTGGAGCGTGSTSPVGAKPLGAGPYGNLDMVGNLWDWVEDCYHSAYTGAPADGSAWTTGCQAGKAIRGGSFWSAAGSIRSSSRHQGAVGVGGFDLHVVGVRCCKSL